MDIDGRTGNRARDTAVVTLGAAQHGGGAVHAGETRTYRNRRHGVDITNEIRIALGLEVLDIALLSSQRAEVLPIWQSRDGQLRRRRNWRELEPVLVHATA